MFAPLVPTWTAPACVIRRPDILIPVPLDAVLVILAFNAIDPP